MTSHSSSSSFLIFSYVVLAFLALLLSPAAAAAAVYGAGGRKVGSRTEVKDVERNQAVQELGLFAVREYNRRIYSPVENDDENNGAGDQHRLLTFSRVAAAESQVVSGLMYYLSILAIHSEDADAGAGAGGEASQPRTFEAVVLSKPWLGVQELISFAPAGGGKNTGVDLKGF